MINSDLLVQNGYKLLDFDKSNNFGDHFEIYTNGEVALRFSNSKSFESVDVCNFSEMEWFDLSLFMLLKTFNRNLIQITTPEEYTSFLEDNLLEICNLMDNRNYPVTKEKLMLIEDNRKKQMFPNW